MRTMRSLCAHFFLLLAVAGVATVAGVTAASAASAGPSRPDLVTTITAPSGVSVYQSGRWGVTVRNLNRRDVSNVVLTIQLPRTANSPTQYVMGTLGAISSGCARSGFTIVCQPRTISRSSPLEMTFDITLPYSTNPIAFTAAAPLLNDQNPGDNQTSATATLATYAVALTAPRTVLNTHCTGSPTLSSFVECVPGSTSSFSADLLPGTTATSGPVTTTEGGGTWTLNGTQLTVDYTDGGTAVAATFVGQGVSLSCWEGKTTFPGSTQYVAIYRVCLQ